MFSDESDDAVNVEPSHDLTTHTIKVTASTHLILPEAVAAAARTAAQTPATWDVFLSAQPLPPSVKAWHLSASNPLKEQIRQGFAAPPV